MRICGFLTCVCLQVYSSASLLRLGPQRVGLAFASVAASGCKPEFSHVRMRENFRGKPRRLKLEQMHMNVCIFKQVSPSLKGPLQLYALHGPMFFFVDRLGFSLSPLGLFPN